MQFTVETEQESDGRWIAEVTDIPGAMKYGKTRGEVIARAEALALRAIAERLEIRLTACTAHSHFLLKY